VIKIAVVGVGHLGRHHARLLAKHPAASLVAVADPRPEALASVQQHCANGVADYRELDGTVEAVVVAVPTSAHREVAGFFLERGVHVLVEKPIASTEAQGLELVELARASGAVLQVGHIERFNAAVRAVREMGIEPRYIESQRLAPFSFRSVDIGVVMDLMIHDLDLVLAMVKSPVISVDAFGGAVFTPAEDMASAILKFQDGAVAHLTASRVALKPLRRMRLFSTDAYASLDFQSAHAQVIRKNPGWDLGRLDVAAVDPSKIEDLWKFVFEGLLSVKDFKLEEGNPLYDELDSFLGTVRVGGRPMVGGEEGSAAVGVAQRILEAIRSNRW
jgi:predicted dehydrogenase